MPLKLKKYLLFNITVALLVASLISFASYKGFLRRAEAIGLDLSFQLRGKLLFNPNIILVEINDADLVQVGRWPWRRTWLAAITRALTDLGAKYIYFDIILSEPSTEEDDSLLEQSLKESKIVYLPFVFQGTSLNTKEAFWPIPRFAANIRSTGCINIYPDSDGITRKVPLVFPTEKETHPHIALKLALDYAGLRIKEINPKYLRVAGAGKEFKIPLVEKNTLLINWVGKWEQTFKHYSFLDVLAKYQYLRQNEIPLESLTDFKNSVCIVAVTAIGLYNIKATPIQPEYPGVGIIATALSNILNNNFIHPAAGWINLLLIYLLALLASLLMSGERPFRETVFVFLLASLYAILNFNLFKKGIGLNLVSPLAGLFTTYLISGTYNFVRVTVERKSFFKMSITDGLTGLYNIRYFKMLLETEIMLTRQAPVKKFAVIMGDIDHFKAFNDTYGHQTGDLVLREVASVLKSATRSSDIVARYGGEEMIILLKGSSLKDGLKIAEKIRQNVENASIKDQKNTYKVTASFGVSTYQPQDTAESVTKRADEGLYQAKESGRNRVCSTESA